MISRAVTSVKNQPQTLMAKQQVAQRASSDADMSSGPYSLSPVQPGDHYSETTSSSLSNTDSADSLQGAASQHRPISKQMSSPANHSTNNNNNNNLSPIASTKSPILIKYNYYDYNGARQEQTNHDMNFNIHNPQAAPTNNVQLQLSPTFKQNLDQIVRNSQQMQQKHSMAARKSTSPTPSPDGQQHQQVLLPFARRYKLSSYEQRCLRCSKTVYPCDKVGPLGGGGRNAFIFFHQNCFKCRACGTKLTLKTYFNNQQTMDDQEVYCYRHCPKTGPGRLDNQSVGIRAALNAPKVFDAVNGPQQQQLEYNQQVSGFNHVHPMHTNGSSTSGQLSPINGAPNVDSRALYIQHAVQQTRIQAAYSKQQQPTHQLASNGQATNHGDNDDDKNRAGKISQLISRRLEFLEPKQKLLEMRHREEEDALFKAFEAKWRQEERSISEQIREEWQVELGKLLAKYKRQLSNISNSSPTSRSLANQQQQQQHLSGVEEQFARQQLKQQQQHEQLQEARKNNNNNMLLMRQVGETPSETSKQQMIERLNLEKTMTIKLDRKKETLKRKLKEFERRATAELVEKQSGEMLALISMKLDEFKEEQRRKLGSDHFDQLEAIEALTSQVGPALQLSAQQLAAAAHFVPGARAAISSGGGNGKQVSEHQRRLASVEAPAPKPPVVSKMELYNSEEPDEVFRDIDQLASRIAREEHQSFTELILSLTRNCETDLMKARAIFRWITEKDLNKIEIDPNVKSDSPFGLLRGIKYGLSSSSYHYLYQKCCSYANIHCKVIKGYSKSAGYQPGVRFEGKRFQNSWNAVFLRELNEWRFVQCNWGARHLVSVAVMQDKNPADGGKPAAGGEPTRQAALQAPTHAGQPTVGNASRSHHNHHHQRHAALSPNHGRRGLTAPNESANQEQLAYSHSKQRISPKSSPASSANLSVSSSSGHSSPSSRSSPQSSATTSPQQQMSAGKSASGRSSNDSLRYEYDDHYFLTSPEEFIYEFYPEFSGPEWQLLERPITLTEFEQLPFVRSLFFKYGLYFPQQNIRSVLYTDSSGATTIKIGLPTHMTPSLIFHYNLKYYDSDLEHYEGVSLKRYVLQSVEAGSGDGLANIVSFRVHLPENGAYILDIFANSTTPNKYITGEPMKFKSVCKFKIIAKNLTQVMIPLPDCASGEYGPMKATRLFGMIPLRAEHESGLITVSNDRRYLDIEFRTTRPLLDFMGSLHKNGYDERQLSKLIKIFIDGDIVIVTIKFFEDGQYGLDLYTRDQMAMPSFSSPAKLSSHESSSKDPKNQLLTHCCKYLINVRTPSGNNSR